MKTLCEKVDWIQVCDSDGGVRVCGWITEGGYIGSLLDNSLSEIYHGEKMNKLRERLANQDYSSCKRDFCPYLMTGEIKDFQIEYGNWPKYPELLRLAYEHACNYRCKSCTICKLDEKDKVKEQLEHNYDIIEERLREALPYVKNLGANGRGEIFCCKRTLKLLSEWKPLAPKEECEVWLETNGSLFDEEHWKQIENLGEYFVGVNLTVMSFDEATYQRLSGVKYPISKIENNLRFVKSLREKGIINHLKLGTVVYADNFRELPEFTRRCLEEFGADEVRLRPYDNWGAQNKIEEFFMNIRNPRHPWYAEYKEIMKDPIFKDPRVLEQSGGSDATSALNLPYEISDLKWNLLTNIEEHPDKVLKEISEVGEFVLYGLGNFTKTLIPKMKQCGIVPICVVDQTKKSGIYEDIPVYNMNDAGQIGGKYPVIVTPVVDVLKIKKRLDTEAFCSNVIPIWEFIDDCKIKERLEHINKWKKK